MTGAGLGGYGYQNYLAFKQGQEMGGGLSDVYMKAMQARDMLARQALTEQKIQSHLAGINAIQGVLRTPLDVPETKETQVVSEEGPGTVTQQTTRKEYPHEQYERAGLAAIDVQDAQHLVVADDGHANQRPDAVVDQADIRVRLCVRIANINGTALLQRLACHSARADACDAIARQRWPGGGARRELVGGIVVKV